MQAKGCFGSILAYRPQSDYCDTCPIKEACGVEVARRRPATMLLLERYNGSKPGYSRAYDWMTKHERRARRHETVGKKSAQDIILSTLSAGPTTMHSLTAGIEAECGYTSQYARRAAYRSVSKMVGSNNVSCVNGIVELK